MDVDTFVEDTKNENENENESQEELIEDDSQPTKTQTKTKTKTQTKTLKNSAIDSKKKATNTLRLFPITGDVSYAAIFKLFKSIGTPVFMNFETIKKPQQKEFRGCMNVYVTFKDDETTAKARQFAAGSLVGRRNISIKALWAKRNEKKFNDLKGDTVRVLVSNLPHKFDKEALEELLQTKVGQKFEKIRFYESTNESWNYPCKALIDFETTNGANKAVAALNNHQIDKHTLFATWNKIVTKSDSGSKLKGATDTIVIFDPPQATDEEWQQLHEGVLTVKNWRDRHGYPMFMTSLRFKTNELASSAQAQLNDSTFQGVQLHVGFSAALCKLYRLTLGA